MAGHRIYVAASWRNPHQPAVVQDLRAHGHLVYDFRNPAPGKHGFAWSDIEPDWEHWDAPSFIAALDHPVAEAGFDSDFDAMLWASRFVLVLPSGRSAHLEAGWAIGQGVPTAILMLGANEPELMYKMAHLLTPSLSDVIEWLDD